MAAVVVAIFLVVATTVWASDGPASTGATTGEGPSLVDETVRSTPPDLPAISQEVRVNLEMEEHCARVVTRKSVCGETVLVCNSALFDKEEHCSMRIGESYFNECGPPMGYCCRSEIHEMIEQCPSSTTGTGFLPPPTRFRLDKPANTTPEVDGVPPPGH